MLHKRNNQGYTKVLDTNRYSHIIRRNDDNMIESSSNLNEDDLKLFFGGGKVSEEENPQQDNEPVKSEDLVDSNMNARMQAKPVMKQEVHTETPVKKTSENIGGSIMNNSAKRNLLVIGTGNGGCNIAATIKRKYPDNIGLILYNTSQKGLRDISDVADRSIIIADADGSGKDRSLSKELFKRGAYKNAIEEINQVSANKQFDYILICTTTDGGTGGGISPIMAKLIRDNVDIPVMILGVFPSTLEDAVAQYNSIEWFNEVRKSEVPYIIFDNDGYNKMQHGEINDIIANHVGVIVGEYFSDSEVSQIDNQDISNVLNDGGHICVYLGDHPEASMEELIKKSHQPEAEMAYSCAVFMKGPESVIRNNDASRVREYFGSKVSFNHLEISNRTKIGVIISGCNPPEKRLRVMKDQYDRMMATTSDNDIDSFTTFSVENPMKAKSARHTEKKSASSSNGGATTGSADGALNLNALDW